MTRRTTFLPSVLSAALIALLAGSCVSTPPQPGPADTQELQTLAMAAQAGNGFVCDGGQSTFTCFCKRGDVGHFSCGGMEQFCRATGHPQTCSADGWCHCGGLYPKAR